MKQGQMDQPGRREETGGDVPDRTTAHASFDSPVVVRQRANVEGALLVFPFGPMALTVTR
jgi:hypothetical protein